MTIRGTVLSTVEQAQIRALKDAGLTYREIARQIGRSHGCVNRCLHNPHGYRSALVSDRPHVLSIKDHRMIARLASNSTWTVDQIRSQGQQFGGSSGQIRT
ncbi:hypothetical protein RB195_013871 [Necator americanus]|uniref:Tc3 transposase DNA binding domain-containing protein n=1 Tax=Necator americanus TaxID=51031 RepID=A0ABR1DXK4_NECAM